MIGEEKQVRNFLSALSGKPDELPAARVARGEVVSAASGGAVDVTIGAGTAEIEVAYLDSYTPNIGDDVLIICFGVDRVILGKLA